MNLTLHSETLSYLNATTFFSFICLCIHRRLLSGQLLYATLQDKHTREQPAASISDSLKVNMWDKNITFSVQHRSAHWGSNSDRFTAADYRVFSLWRLSFTSESQNDELRIIIKKIIIVLSLNSQCNLKGNNILITHLGLTELVRIFMNNSL